MKTVKWIVIGEVVGTHSNRGEIKVIPHTEFPERFLKMDTIRFFRPDGAEPLLTLEVENSRFHKQAVLIKLKGIAEPSAAEKLRKMLIKVSLEELMPLPPGRHYIFELLGLECSTTTGLKLGVIDDVLETGANDVFVLKPHPGVTGLKEILIPVIEDVVLEIKPEEGRVLVDLPDGLLD